MACPIHTHRRPRARGEIRARRVRPRAAAGAFQERASSDAISQRREACAPTPTQASSSFLAGEGEELHTTVAGDAARRAGVRLFLQVRNKVVQAYQEVMRMQM